MIKNQDFKELELIFKQDGEIIRFADSLIDDLGSETMKDMWKQFIEEKYQEWKNRRS